MDYLVYLLYRGCTAVVTALPMGIVFRLGQLAGWLAYLLLPPYRRLALANLRIAYGESKTRRELRRLARAHFIRLGANLLSSVKATRIGLSRLHEMVAVEGMPILREALDRGRGVVLVISHIGNWELFAELCQMYPGYRFSTIYQPLGNRYIEADVQRLRTQHGVALFNRKSGFHGPIAFLRAGGAVGVLVDQHAGDSGVWAPFFGRLASTSNLAALLALRTGAELVPLAVYTAGTARWRFVISPPIEPPPGRSSKNANALTAEINRVLETQINVSPADWFWVHNRWKTPQPKFLLEGYRRGFAPLGDGSAQSGLKPFRILVRSPNWLGDAVMTIPAVQSIAGGRPDAHVTVLTPAKLADLWREVAGVDEVLEMAPGSGWWRVAGTIRSAGDFDAAVILPNSTRSALEAWWAGVPRRVGFRGRWRRLLLNQIVPEPPGLARARGSAGIRRQPRHQARRYAHLAHELGAGGVTAREPESPPAQAVAPGGWVRIGICPGAEYGPAKRWLPERFAATAVGLSKRVPCAWVLFGTPRDAAEGALIEMQLGERCENLIGQTTLAQLIAELRRCHALLTNDTGTMHLAAWLGVPVAAVFGSTDPRLTGPVAPPERIRILRHQVVCSPCFLARCPLDLRCMHVVGAEEAEHALLQLLGEPAQLAERYLAGASDA